MGDEVPIQSVGRQAVKQIERIDTTRMRGKGYSDIVGQYKQRPCTYANIMQAEHGAEQNSAIPKRAIIAVVAGGVSGVKEKILGSAFVGQRIFLCYSRQCGRGNDKELHRESREDREERSIQSRGMSFSHNSACV